MKIKERLIGLTLIGLIAAAAWVGMTQNNTPAPDITLTSITGKQITLKNLQGRPVIVTFWATDSANDPC